MRIEKVRCTVAEKVLIHLLKYTSSRDLWDAPFEVTQNGIAECLGIMRPAVARELLLLKQKDLVFDKSSHIKGEARRKKAYFLSEEGIVRAREIKQNLFENFVWIKTPDNELQKMKLSKINSHFKIDLSLIELIKYLSPKGIFDHESAVEFNKKLEFEKDLKKVKRKRAEELPTRGLEELKSLEFSDKVPGFKHFFGRTKELKKIKGALKSETSKIIVIYGIAGIGKTTLVSKLVTGYKKSKNIFWYSFGRWNAFRNVMTSLSEFLFKLGKRRLGTYLRSGKTFELGKFLDLIESELNGESAILVFDDFQRADEKTLELFSSLVNVMERVEGVSLIVISRELPAFYNRRDVKIKKLVAEFKLEGLDIKSSKQLLNFLKIDDDAIKSIDSIIHGHPLALELMESIDYIVYQKDFNKFIEEEILRELTKAEIIILKSASVYRYPIQSKALLIRSEYAGVNYDTLSKLIKRSLIQELPENKFDTHDFIKEFFYERLTPHDIRVYHISAANYYSEISGDFAIIEMLFHLIKAKKFEDAANQSLEAGHGLIYKGYVEFMNILEEFNTDNLPRELWEEILILKGDAALRMGAFDHAIEYYQDDLELLSEKHDAKKIIELYEKMGEAHGKKGEWDWTINLLKKSIELCLRHGDKKGMARAQNNLGLAYRNIRNYNEALKYYRRAIKLLNEQNEVVGISLTNINIGKINELQNDFDRAFNLYSNSLLTFKDAKYSPGIIKAHNALGNLYFKRYQWNQAVKEFLESLKVSEKVNDKNNIITVSTNIGDSFYHLKIYDSALQFYYQSMNTIEELIALQKSYNPYRTSKYRRIFSGEPAEQSEYDRADLERIMVEYQENLGKLHNKIGNVYRARKNFGNAIKSHTKSRKIYQESKNRKSLAKTNINLGIDYQLKREYNNALSSYKNALRELEALKEYIGMVVTYNNIGKIYELKGQQNKAVEFYKKCLLLSKQIRFRVGVKKANMAIKNISRKSKRKVL